MSNDDIKETITITRKEYDSLKEDSFKLLCLEDGGVDNWDWYSESLKPYYKKYYPEDFDDEDKDF